jgi:ATP-dependent exoDNAse (exonuclease V) alpha subunit
LHRTVDDPTDFANIRARLMASNDLVLLKPQQVDADRQARLAPAVFTTRDILRIEYDMAQSAQILSQRKGAGSARARLRRRFVLLKRPIQKSRFTLDREQVDAVRHVTGDNGIAAVVGLAGAGKSTLLAAARVAWESDERPGLRCGACRQGGRGAGG